MKLKPDDLFALPTGEEVDFVTFGTVVPIDALGDAWAELEDELPEGWAIDSLTRMVGDDGHVSWRAEANDGGDGFEFESAFDLTPATALRSLAEKLRERPTA